MKIKRTSSQDEKLSTSQQLEATLKILKLKILKLDPSKSRAVGLSIGGAISIEKFCQKLLSEGRAELLQFPDIANAVYAPGVMAEILEEYARSKRLLVSAPVTIEVPDSYSELTLNLDQSYNGKDLRFFMTTPDEYISSSVSGNVYLRVCGIKDEEAIATSRKVVPEYRPRSKPGIINQKSITHEAVPVFNSYVPPEWMKYDGKVPDRLPPLFEKLVNHLFPLKKERQYFYDWLHASLFDRAFVYLILCGAGGTGKNRLKLVLRALHGHQNTVDGKRSTLVDRFNSQLADSTLAWFDELTYDLEMENVMKEIQNDSISIERKGVDATRSTKIYSSLVISNNKPRDNYIAFDARKFVPLQIANTRLDTVMSEKEIQELTDKVQAWDSPKFDVAFLAQIGRWIQKNGNPKRWPLLEYRGPMFYKLAHTSMSRWQKKAASLLLDPSQLTSSRITFDKKRGYLWSTVADVSQKKNGDRSLQFPEYTTVKHFFDLFVDSEGTKTFETSSVRENIMGDFYVKVLHAKAHIMTEAEIAQLSGGDSEEDEIEDHDLL